MKTGRICLPNELQTIVLNRKKIAKFLRVSLPTLTDWIKSALPSHKQRVRVYSEIQNRVIKIWFEV